MNNYIIFAKELRAYRYSQELAIMEVCALLGWSDKEYLQLEEGYYRVITSSVRTHMKHKLPRLQDSLFKPTDEAANTVFESQEVKDAI